MRLVGTEHLNICLFSGSLSLRSYDVSTFISLSVIVTVYFNKIEIIIFSIIYQFISLFAGEES
jgi:hypothetical protein